MSNLIQQVILDFADLPGAHNITLRLRVLPARHNRLRSQRPNP